MKTRTRERAAQAGLVLITLSLLSLPRPLLAQSTTRRPVRGPVSGLELSLEGATVVERGEHLRWMATLYDIVGVDELRPVRAGQLRVLTDYQPDRPVVEIVTDEGGRAQLDFVVPEDQRGPFHVIIEALSPAARVQRQFELDVEVSEPHRLELFVDRWTPAPGERVNLFGRALYRWSGRPLVGATLQIRVADGRGRAIRPAQTLVTGPGGGWILSFTAPEQVSSLTVEATLDSGERAEVRLTVQPRAAPSMIVMAAPERSLAAPGDQVAVDVVVRRPDGRPLPRAVLTFSGDLAPEPAPATPSRTRPPVIRTDELGRARLSWRPSSSSPPQALEARVARVTATHAGLGQASAEISLRLTRVDYQLGLSVEGGALIPGLPGKVFLRVARADGEPAPRGVPIQVESELLGRHSVVTDDQGFALVEAVAEVRPGLTGRDRCGGATASAISLRVGEGARALLVERCLPVDPDGTVRLRAARPVVTAGGQVALTILRERRAASWPLLITAISTQQGRVVPLSQQTVGASSDEVTLTLPPDVSGEVILRARVLVGPNRQEVRGGSTLVWVTRGERVPLEIATGGGGEVTLSAAEALGDRGLNGLILAMSPAEAQDLLERLLDTQDPIAQLLGDPSRASERQVAGLLAARTPRDVAAPAVLRGRTVTAMAAPEVPAEQGILRDPWRARARFVRGRLALVMRALERYLVASIADGIESVGHRSPRGWTFNQELLEAVSSSEILGAAGARALSGQRLTLSDLEAMDPAFTFDNMARRITRERLLRVLVALRSFVRDRHLDLRWSRAGTDPTSWLSLITDDLSAQDDESGRSLLLDGWGRPMAIRRGPRGAARFEFMTPLPQGYELVSAGPDGRFGSADDVFDPFARVLPSGGVYAEAVGEDELLARLGGVELGQATISQLASLFEIEGSSEPLSHASEVGTSEVGWTDLAGVVEPPVDLAAFERFWEPLLRGPAEIAAIPRGGLRPSLSLDAEPRRYGVVAVAWTDEGGISSAQRHLRRGEPLLIDVPPLERLRLEEPLELPVTVAWLPGGPRQVRLSVQIEGGLSASLEAPEGLLDLSGPGVATTTLRVEGQRAGQGSFRVEAVGVDDAGVRRAVTRRFWVDEGDLLREQVAATSLAVGRGLELSVPRSASRARGQLVVTPPSALALDPRARALIERDPALLAWAQTMAGLAIPEALALQLQRLVNADGGVSGDDPALSTACAVVVWSAMEESAAPPRRTREAAVRWLISRRGAEAGEVRRVATLLVALASGASGLPGTGADPLSAHVSDLRDDLRGAIRAHRRQPGALARAAAALLLVERRDLRGQALFARAREHLVPGFRGGLVVDLDAPSPAEEERPGGEATEAHGDPRRGAEQIVATAALAIAAIQADEPELAHQLGQGLAARAHLAYDLGGEPLFWLLSAGAYGVFGVGATPEVTVEVDGRRQQVVLDEGPVTLPLDLPRAGRSLSVRLTPGGQGVIPLARVEARYGLPAVATQGSPLRVELQGDPGFAGERAAFEVTLRHEGREAIERPRLLIALPASAAVDEASLAALERTGGVLRVHRPDRRGVVEVELSPLQGGAQLRLPLAFRWIASGEVRGLGLAAFDAERTFELSVAPGRRLSIEERPAEP